MQNHRYPNSGMGISAGVYILEENKMDIEFAIENANLAWKNAKNTGKRDITLYNPSLRIQRTEEQKIVGEFYEALYRDDSRCICSQSLFYVTGVFMGQKHWHDGNVRMERFFRRECLLILSKK